MNPSSEPTIEFSALTHIGRKRRHNEDNFLVDPQLGLYVVCDGMGGHAAGEVASAMAVYAFHEEVSRERQLLQDYLRRDGTDTVSEQDILQLLRFATNRASHVIHHVAQSDNTKRGMGTTLAAVLCLGSQAFIVHVGDSRVYLLRENTVRQMTQDHSISNELARYRHLTRDHLRRIAPKNAITRAVGVHGHCEPDIQVVELSLCDRLLLCSDGLSTYFERPHGDIEELASELAQPDVEMVMHSLIDKANERGGKDNITGVVISVGGRVDPSVDPRELGKSLLKRVPFFTNLSESELCCLSELAQVMSCEGGEPIIKRGDSGVGLYLVLSGALTVDDGGDQPLTLRAGQHVGDLALLRPELSTVTVRSAGPSKLLRLRRDDFLGLLHHDSDLAAKLFWQSTSVLADRLTSAMRNLRQAQEEITMSVLSSEIFGEEDGGLMPHLPGQLNQDPLLTPEFEPLPSTLSPGARLLRDISDA